MKIEDHFKRLNESLAVLEESIQKGIADRQRIIGFCTSAGCADLLEILLHKNNFISPGFVIKHEWFNSRRKIEEKFPFDFPHKNEILELIQKIEGKRNSLCYGKPKKEEAIKEVIENFNKIQEIFREAGIHE